MQIIEQQNLDFFNNLTSRITNQTVIGIWRGHGSSVFIEIGDNREYTQQKTNNPTGIFTIMIEWSWRIENQTRILSGSFGDSNDWENIFHSINGMKILAINLFGKLPEIIIEF